MFHLLVTLRNFTKFLHGNNHPSSHYKFIFFFAMFLQTNTNALQAVACVSLTPSQRLQSGKFYIFLYFGMRKTEIS